MKRIVILLASLLILIFISLIGVKKYFPKKGISLLTPVSTPFQTPSPSDVAAEITISSVPQIQNIFSEYHNWTATLSADRIITLMASGDVIPARSVNQMTVKNNDFTWAFKNISSITQNADITLVNLESPLIRNCPITNEGMVFCGDSRHVEGLVYAGTDIVNLANNHSGNHGSRGIGDTINTLEANGMLVTGTGSAVVKKIKGIRFAFLGYNDIEKFGSNPSSAHEETIRNQVTEVKKTSDVVIVSFHWGTEYTSQPDERQISLAHLAIDAGADIVIGNHPHWIQPVEIYQGKFITYAHGNTVFDQMWSEKTKEGVIGKYTFLDKKLIEVEFFPLYIKNFGQPEFLAGDRKNKILEDMKYESIRLENRLKGF